MVGFQFKPKLSAVLAVLNGVSVGLAYVVSQGNITATITWFARNNRRNSRTMLQRKKSDSVPKIRSLHV